MSWSLALTFKWSMQVSGFKECKKARQQMGILYRKFYPFGLLGVATAPNLVI